jgi:hypothetical protein
MDFRSPDYEPLDGFVGLTLPTPGWKIQESWEERETFGRKIYSDVRTILFNCSLTTIPHSGSHYVAMSYHSDNFYHLSTCD